MSYAAEYRLACREARRVVCDREIQAHMRHSHAVRYLDGRICFSGTLLECHNYIGRDRGYDVVEYTSEMLTSDIQRLRAAYR